MFSFRAVNVPVDHSPRFKISRVVNFPQREPFAAVDTANKRDEWKENIRSGSNFEFPRHR